MELHEKIKMLRKERGYTQSQVADKIGQERSTVACYENGSRKPAVDVLEKLAHLYGVTLDYFSNKSDSDIMLQLLAQSSEFFRSVGISEADKTAVFSDIMQLYLDSKKVGVSNDDKVTAKGRVRER
jgi:transcriptional regulator with XRE-family HTH domain